MSKAWLVLGSLLVAGCNLYFGGDDRPPPMCNEPTPEAPQQVRNPQTGECEPGWGGGGGGSGCWDSPTAGTASGGDTGALPNWATCGGACDALDESACLTTAGCHAEYSQDCPGDVLCKYTRGTFWTCTATPPWISGDQSACAGLEAERCSERDDCASGYLHPVDPTGTHAFQVCFPESGANACDTTSCGAGTHCEQQCDCDPNSPADTGCALRCTAMCVPDLDCAVVDCAVGSHCEEQCQTPVCDPPPPGYTCPGETCVAACVPDALDPGDCYGAVSCDPAPPSCPSTTTPGVKNGCWTGYCIPTSECSHDPGTCSNNGGVMCALAPPACPSGTQPGIKNGCWSGYCIPDSACGPVACAAITDESTCVSRADCSAVYDGTNCTCDPSGACTCQDTKFARCTLAGKL